MHQTILYRQNLLQKAPRQCRYKDKCRRQTTCLCNHKAIKHSEYATRKEENKKVKQEIQIKLEETKSKFVELPTESDELKLRLNQANDEITKQAEINQKSKATHDKVIDGST